MFLVPCLWFFNFIFGWFLCKNYKVGCKSKKGGKGQKWEKDTLNEQMAFFFPHLVPIHSELNFELLHGFGKLFFFLVNFFWGFP